MTTTRSSRKKKVGPIPRPMQGVPMTPRVWNRLPAADPESGTITEVMPLTTRASLVRTMVFSDKGVSVALCYVPLAY
jgi:hypothetical protein